MLFFAYSSSGKTPSGVSYESYILELKPHWASNTLDVSSFVLPASSGWFGICCLGRVTHMFTGPDRCWASSTLIKVNDLNSGEGKLSVGFLWMCIPKLSFKRGRKWYHLSSAITKAAPNQTPVPSLQKKTPISFKKTPCWSKAGKKCAIHRALHIKAASCHKTSHFLTGTEELTYWKQASNFIEIYAFK